MRLIKKVEPPTPWWMSRPAECATCGSIFQLVNEDKPFLKKEYNAISGEKVQWRCGVCDEWSPLNKSDFDDESVSVSHGGEMTCR